MPNPSQMAYKVLIFTERLRFFFIDVSVDCGTPLFSNSAYLVMLRSMQSCSILKAIASSNNILLTPK